MKSLKELVGRNWFLPILTGLGVTVILLVVFIISGYAPFGEKSLTMFDADIQYLDFFAYLKDVLAGKNDVAYTFSKTLGGDNIAVFSYYLASPFNLLVVFFSKADLVSFFDIVVLLKLTLAGILMAVFLQERFHEQLCAFPKRKFFIPLLALGYSLSQYPLAQSNGIMWLDAVYLLPLVLLGVYKVIRERKSTLLTVTVALTILFNWYTGAIVCIFAVGWFFAEYFLVRKKVSVRDFFGTAIHFGVAMGLGVLISCILFLPTIGALSSGNRAVLETDRLYDFSFIENIFPGILVKYRPGAVSAFGYVSLYCGILAAVGVIGCFFSSAIIRRKKVIFALILILTVLIFYWNPFVMLFSLLKNVDTYWYRYSFVGIFSLLFLAAQFYLRRVKVDWKKPVYMGIATLAVGDAGLNAYLIYKVYSVENVVSYREYASQAEKQEEVLKEYDDGTYRISQTSNRGNNTNPYALTPNYNEALAYDYWSISGYTSSPDDVQRDFLHRVGYHINGENMCITNASVLGADSLLGVKYIWSAYPIKGLEKVEELGEYNGKQAYKNPFVVPMAFIARGEGGSVNGQLNPFEYQNNLYSKIYGKEVELYRKLKFTTEDEKYLISIPEGNFVTYANLEWNDFFDEEILVNGQYSQPYAKWLTPSVFYVPTKTGDDIAELKLSEGDLAKVRDPQFYALDLDLLKLVTDSFQEKPNNSIIKNGYVEFELSSSSSEQKLFTTIPIDKGWEITQNGERISPEVLGDAFYTFSLVEGNNKIEMIYHPPKQRMGILIFGVGTFGAVVTFLIERRRSRRSDRKDEEFAQDVV